MDKSRVGRTSRRSFVKSVAASSVALSFAPAIATARKSDSALVVGTGDHRYEVQHLWPELPSQFTWQTTHNVAVDSEGLLYVIHEGHLGQKDHPSIFVFDQQGKYVRSFGKQFQGGGHGLEVRNEGGQDFLYVCAYQQQRSFAKLDTEGEEVWRQGAPMESGLYTEGEDKFPREANDNPWGRNRFMPTNIAFHADGGFYVADGYGAFCIHRYDRDGKWLSKFGGSDEGSKADGVFNLPHGVWIDNRGEGEAKVVVADRVNARLQWFSLEGKHLETLDGFLLPANLDTFGEILLVPDLVGRVTLLDGDNKVIAHLGDDHARIQEDQKQHNGFNIRTKEATWLPGKFIHPHDACFDKEGNIFVAEWVQRGRVTKLTRV